MSLYISPKDFVQLIYALQIFEQLEEKKWFWSHTCPSLLTGEELHRYELKWVFASMFHHSYAEEI